MTRDEIKQKLIDHGKWLIKREGGCRADFSWQDLSGYDFSGMNISGAIFNAANCNDAIFYKVHAIGSLFQGTKLLRANFNESNIMDAVFYYSDLTGSKMVGCTASGACFEGATLTKADLSSSNMSNANFKNANMYLTVMNKTFLESSNLIGANIEYAKMEDPHESFMSQFRKTREGWIVYYAKNIAEEYSGRKRKLYRNKIICLHVNPCVTDTFGCGIKFGTLEYFQTMKYVEIWECIILFDAHIVVPYNTSERVARCNKIQFIRKIGITT